MALHFAEPITDLNGLAPDEVERAFILPERLAVELAALAEAAGTSARDELITALELHLDAMRGADFEELTS